MRVATEDRGRRMTNGVRMYVSDATRAQQPLLSLVAGGTPGRSARGAKCELIKRRGTRSGFPCVVVDGTGAEGVVRIRLVGEKDLTDAETLREIVVRSLDGSA